MNNLKKINEIAGEIVKYQDLYQLYWNKSEIRIALKYEKIVEILKEIGIELASKNS